MDTASEALPYTNPQKQRYFALRLFTNKKQSERVIAHSTAQLHESTDIHSKKSFPINLDEIVHKKNGERKLQILITKNSKFPTGSKKKVEIKQKVINDKEVISLNDKICILPNLQENVLN